MALLAKEGMNSYLFHAVQTEGGLRNLRYSAASL